MYATGNKKMLNMLILDILKEYSDENHKLTQQEIMRLLKSNYDMTCDRKSVRNNVDYLKELGYEISTDGGYYLITREFDDAELRMLIDSVLFSKTLTQKQAKSLIDKLSSLGNRYFNSKSTYICNLPELHHADNKQLMYALDSINEAISEKRKISFMYNSYGTDLKLHPRREEMYVINPYQIVANNGFFYLIGNYDKYDNVSHYRLDKMTCVKVLEEKVKPKNQVEEFKNGYNLPKHMAEHIYMFSGASIHVKFLVEEDLIGDVIDWFGKDFQILENKDGMLKVSVRCNENAMFFWALQYGPYVEVVEPQGLRNRLSEEIKKMSCKYEN